MDFSVVHGAHTYTIAAWPLGLLGLAAVVGAIAPPVMAWRTRGFAAGSIATALVSGAAAFAAVLALCAAPALIGEALWVGWGAGEWSTGPRIYTLFPNQTWGFVGLSTMLALQAGATTALFTGRTYEQPPPVANLTAFLAAAVLLLALPAGVQAFRLVHLGTMPALQVGGEPLGAMHVGQTHAVDVFLDSPTLEWTIDPVDDWAPTEPGYMHRDLRMSTWGIEAVRDVGRDAQSEDGGSAMPLTAGARWTWFAADPGVPGIELEVGDRQMSAGRTTYTLIVRERAMEELAVEAYNMYGRPYWMRWGSPVSITEWIGGHPQPGSSVWPCSLDLTERYTCDCPVPMAPPTRCRAFDGAEFIRLTPAPPGAG